MQVDRALLVAAVERESATYVENTPGSRALFQSADHLLGRVPMTWMNKWAGGYPLYLQSAHGNTVVDVDGNSYIDFSLGDTGSMAGHSPPATVEAITTRIGAFGGITTMLPTSDAEWVAGELTRRFGLPVWSFTLTATDANRWAIRIARLVTGRSKVASFSYCYHGSVDETFAVLTPGGTTVLRDGGVGAPVDIALTTAAMEWNDIESVRRALEPGDVAVLVTEPALTNIGIVLPEDGFLEAVRDLCDRYGTLLLIDETHTISAGWGGATTRWSLRPDLFVIGKSIGGGIPSGAYGLTEEIAAQIGSHAEADLIDVGGVGGTLAGNAMSVAAMRATLEHVLTVAAFDLMESLAAIFTAGVQHVIDAHDLDWSISQLGARAEYRFARPAPRTGTESAAAEDDLLDDYLHLYMLNRGIMMTPFHNMALMCPTSTRAQVDTHTAVFEQAVAAIVT